MTTLRVTVALPVHNEERQLAGSVRRLAAVLRGLPGWSWEVAIADNGSRDQTWAWARRLASIEGVRACRLEQQGRGGALRAVWSASDADVVAYMDIDLSTHLRHLPELLGPLARGDADVVTGSRLMPGARVRRGWRREILSRGYNLLARRLTGSRLHDHQCGFKAISRPAAADLLPRMVDVRWFFDTELLVLAQRRGWRVREIPVCWRDDTDSRVRLLSTMVQCLRGLWRLRRGRPGAGPGGPVRRRVFT